MQLNVQRIEKQTLLKRKFEIVKQFKSFGFTRQGSRKS
jgi:hypothetical protein